MKDAKVQVMGIDAGGTMTDTFFVKENGSFVVGKAQSNPEDESLAIYNSSQDALSHWKSDVDKVYPELITWRVFRHGDAQSGRPKAWDGSGPNLQ